MNQTVQAFLDAEKEKARKRRQQELIDLGFFEREYAPDNQGGEEYPFFEWGSDDAPPRHYKKTALDVTEEEYQEILKYTNVDKRTASNPIAKVLDVTAWIFFIGGFIGGLVASINPSYYDTAFSFATALIYWFAAFLSGMLILGLSEIIKLLDAIRKK